MLTMHPIPGPDSKLVSQLLQLHAVKHLSTLLHHKLCPEDQAEVLSRGKSVSLSGVNHSMSSAATGLSS